MNKLIYSLATVLLGLASCTSFDDPTTENYGAGPSVDVTITAGTPSDSAFTVVITPAAGSLYYAYAISEGTRVAVDSATLYKGGYSNDVVKVADKATTTLTIDDAKPNTTYYVYAVAGSDKGIIGNMTVQSITTTDVLSPGPKTIQKDEDNAAVKLTFSEAIQRGEGAVTAQYYKEWDILRPVEVPAEDLTVQVSGSSVIFAANNIPAGAYLCFSYAEGAFKDAKGNLCRALNSGLDLSKGQFTGAWVHVTNVPFEIEDEYVTAPADGALIAKVEDFKGTITFPFDVYRNEEAVEAGDLSVTYTNANRTATYKLSADNWSVTDNVINFVLPASPVGGDFITVSLVDGAVTDVLGNPNAAYTSSAKWQFFAPTVDMILGTFEIRYISYWSEDGSASSMGKITIEQNGEKENSVLIKGLFLENSVIEGTYDLSNAKLYIPDNQVLGEYTEDGAVYTTYFYTADDADAASFTINADGTLSGDGMWGLYVVNVADADDKGWIDVAKVSLLNPVKAAAARKAAKAAKKSMKLHKAARTLKKQVRK